MMVHEEWLNEGDVVFCELQVKYFKELIEFMEKHPKVRDMFRGWKLSQKR